MISQQMDVFFLEKDHKNNTFKTEYAKKIGTIWPPNPSMGFNDPNLSLDFIPQRQGKMVVLPKGQKPGQGAGQQQGGYQQGGYPPKPSHQMHNQGGPQQIQPPMGHGGPNDPNSPPFPDPSGQPGY